MKSVYKYPLTAAVNGINMPGGAKVLSVQEQPGFMGMGHGVYLWAEVDPKATTEKRVFRLVATGGQIDPAWLYVGTVVQASGYVWQVYEVISTERP